MKPGNKAQAQPEGSKYLPQLLVFKPIKGLFVV